MIKRIPVSTNVASRTFLGGISIAEAEHRNHALLIAQMQTSWRTKTNALHAAIPSIVNTAAAQLDSNYRDKITRVITAIIAREIEALTHALMRPASGIAGLLTREKEIEQAHALLVQEFRPALEIARDLAQFFSAHPLPPPAATATVRVPLVSFLRDGKGALSRLARIIVAKQSACPALLATLARNLAHATGGDPSDHSRPIPSPHTLEGSAEQVAVLAFSNTPLLELLLMPVAIAIPLETRFRHTHVVAGAGWGKTQTLQHMIAEFLSSASPPSLVIIDSQGEMLDNISRLDLFAPGQGRLAGRLVIIDPRDINHPPSLNLFAVNQERMRRMGDGAREQIMNGLVELYEGIFGAMLGAELTQKQMVLFRFLARLMLVIPNATIHTLRDVLEDPKPFMPFIALLTPTARSFLEKQLASRDFDQTRDQVIRRLYGILEQPTFERMFSTPSLKIDLFDCLQTGKIVLVNTAKDFLKTERSKIMGRVFAALTLQAVIERAAIPAEQRRPAFLIVDEAHEYLDHSMKQILEQARKYKLGLIAAHQAIEQLSPELKAALASNTAIKLAGGVSDADAHTMAREMKTTPDAIRALERRGGSTQFLTYIDGVTPHAIPITTPFGTLERIPRMSSASFDALIADNQRRYCQQATIPRSATPAPIPHSPPAPPARANPKPKKIPTKNDDWWS